MDKALFGELVTSLKEAQAIRKGKKPAARRTNLVTRFTSARGRGFTENATLRKGHTL